MKKRSLALVLAALALLALLSGCGSASGASRAADAAFSAADGEYYYEEAYEEEALYWDAPAAAAAPQRAAADPNPPAEGSDEAVDPAKVIYTADMEMETLEFDEAYRQLSALVTACGGYFESSSVYEQGSARRASLTVRVPAGSYRAFIDQAGEVCHVLSRSENAEDVSERYYDTAGRLQTQRTKLDRLQALLKDAATMEDIIELENAISDTEETIDRLSGELRHYDALVDYSTVTIYLREVKVYEETPPETYGSRLGSAFSRGWHGFVSGLGDIVVALAYSWLWLLLIAAIVFVIVRLVKRRRAKHPKQAKAAPPANVSYSAPAARPEDDREE